MKNSTLTLNETFRMEFPVTCDNMTPDYRVKLTSALAMFQDTVASYMTTKHLAAFDLKGRNLIWVVPEHDVRFKEDVALWRESVVSEIIVSELTPVRVHFDFKLYVEGKEPFATGEGVWALVDMSTKRTANMCDYFPIVTEGECIKHKKLIIPAVQEAVKEADYVTTFRDMDFNRHVGNRSYIDIALKFVPEEFMETHFLKSLKIKFIRQTFIGDSLKSRYAAVPDDPESFIVSQINGAGEEACRMEMSFGVTTRKVDIAAEVSRE